MTDANQEKIAPGALLKQVVWNGTTTLVGTIDNGSFGCLLRASAAARCGAEQTTDDTALYGFGSQGTPSDRAIEKCHADIEIDGVIDENVPFLVAPDDSLGRPARGQNVHRATLRGFCEARWLFTLLAQK